MILEVVVRRYQNRRCVDFKERLPSRVTFLNKAEIQRPDACLRGDEHWTEHSVFGHFSTRTRSCVSGLGLASMVSRHPESESCLVVLAARAAVERDASADVVAAPNI